MSTIATRKPRRAAVACQACHSRKTRCDGKRPKCEYCTRTGGECLYGLSSSRQAKPGRLSAENPVNTGGSVIQTILKRLDDVEFQLSQTRGVLAQHDGRGQTSSPQRFSGHIRDSNLPVRLSPDIPSSYVPGPSPSDSRNEPTPHDNSVGESSGSPEGRAVLPEYWWTMTVEDTLQWPILAKAGASCQALESVIDSSNHESEDDFVDADIAIHARDPHLNPTASLGKSKNFKFREAECGVVQPCLESLEDREVIYELVEAFLNLVQSKNPVLDPTVLRRNAAMTAQNGLRWDGKTCQVLLACALGCLASPYIASSRRNFTGQSIDAERYVRSTRFYTAASQRMGLILEHSDIMSTQCLFLAGMYLMYIMKPFAAWRIFNTASMACYGYLTNVKAKQAIRGTHPSENSKEIHRRNMEQRLYWSCLKSERELADEFGLELSALSQVQYPHSLPSPPSNPALRSDINEAHASPGSMNATTTTPSHSAEEEQSWYYYLTEITLRKLEMQIDNFFQRRRREGCQIPASSKQSFLHGILHAIAEFDDQLNMCYASIPPLFHFSLAGLPTASSSSDGDDDELSPILHYRILRIRHDLYRPALYFILHGVHDDTHDARDDTGETSPPSDLGRRMTQLAHESLRIDITLMNICSSAHRHHGTWLALRIVVRSALEVIAARRSGLVPAGVLVGFEEAAAVVRRFLLYWGGESTDALLFLKVLAELDPAFSMP